MILAKVEYEFFDFEEPSAAARELARQIRLLFSDSPGVYVSWTWARQHGPDDQPYSIAYGPSSYFSNDADFTVDASDFPLWSRHIGRDVALTYPASTLPTFEFQVLEIRSGSDRTYLSSLGLDRIRVSDTPPILQGDGQLPVHVNGLERSAADGWHAVRLLTGATIGVGLAGVGMMFAGAGHGPLLPFLAIAGPVALLRPFAAEAGQMGNVFTIVMLAGVAIEYGAYGWLTGRWRGRPDRAKRILALVAVHAACSALSIAQLYADGS